MASFLSRGRAFLRTLPFRGKGRFCPVCHRESRRFGPAGVVPRPEARCIHCGALERHRLTWLYFAERTDLFRRGTPPSMLHIAPEPVFVEPLRRRLGAGYLTADLLDPQAMVRMDVTDIRYPDESFDVIHCSHVLEHVPDDRKAMREFARVLRSGGWATLQVPVEGEATVEDPYLEDPAERLRRFGQKDHVRIYGRDFADRLREAGFVVETVEPADFLTGEQIDRMRITAEAGQIYLCRKQPRRQHA